MPKRVINDMQLSKPDNNRSFRVIDVDNVRKEIVLLGSDRPANCTIQEKYQLEQQMKSDVRYQRV